PREAGARAGWRAPAAHGRGAARTGCGRRVGGRPSLACGSRRAGRDRRAWRVGRVCPLVGWRGGAPRAATECARAGARQTASYSWFFLTEVGGAGVVAQGAREGACLVGIVSAATVRSGGSRCCPLRR